jgi:hypothetical protein
MAETLGAQAHRGGMLVRRPELTVGMVQAIARPSGLEVELIARQPLDRRSATERQDDIRAGRDRVTAAPRNLLPAFDEGLELRVGWLDQAGRAHWQFGSYKSSSGDHYQGAFGPSFRTVVTFPPMYDQLSLVLAWPEIGFPEAVISLSLPDRATVERETRPIWQAPVAAASEVEPLNQHLAAFEHEELSIEEGRVVAAPQVLHRREDAAVVLTRLTAVGSVLSVEILSVARDAQADAVRATAFPRSGPPPGMAETVEQLRVGGPAASVAVIRGRDAFWLHSVGGSSTGGPGTFTGAQDFMIGRPDDGVVDLMVTWPLAGLPDRHVRVSLDER